MGKMFTATFENITMAAIQDAIELVAGSASMLIVHGWEISQKSDVGDAKEAGVRLQCKRASGAFTSGSSGSAVTVQPVTRGDSFGGTCERNNTTQLSGGTIDVLETHMWNARVPFLMLYSPEMRPIVKPSEAWLLSLPAAPADGSIDASLTVWFEQIG